VVENMGVIILRILATVVSLIFATASLNEYTYYANDKSNDGSALLTVIIMEMLILTTIWWK